MSGLLDGCLHVYIDVGTNIGLQLRKVFEPQRFPLASILPIFDEYFGTAGGDDDADRRRNVCAVGFEPNPTHSARLTELAERYRSLGWRTFVNVQTAAATSSGNTTFYFDATYHGKHNFQWGASTIPPEQIIGRSTTVTTVDLARWLRREVFNRRLPSRSTSRHLGRPHVVMKLDIEGGEHVVLPHLLNRGVLCEIDYLYAEFHNMSRAEGYDADLGTKISSSLAATPGCKLKLTSLDDEVPLTPQGPFCKRVAAKVAAGQTSNMLKYCYDVPPLP